MRAAQLIASRSPQWAKLERLCHELEQRGLRRNLSAHRRVEFAALYRSACADLALADAHALPTDTVRYLHHLVGRAHGQLYRTRGIDAAAWRKELLHDVPRRLFHDGYLRVAAFLFWGAFLASVYLASGASPAPGFAEEVIGRDMISQFEAMYADSPNQWKRPTGSGAAATGFYISHNATIGLRCFAMGLLLGVGGLFEVVFNAVFLGAVFGHMATTTERDNFFHFVTAHGPFELTAVVLSAAAGMRLGFAVVSTDGLTRRDALLRAGRTALPTMFAAVLLFMLAAVIEGCVSPSPLPYGVKAVVAMLSTLLLLWYFVVLGYAQHAEEPHDTPPEALPW